MFYLRSKSFNHQLEISTSFMPVFVNNVKPFDYSVGLVSSTVVLFTIPFFLELCSVCNLPYLLHNTLMLHTSGKGPLKFTVSSSLTQSVRFLYLFHTFVSFRSTYKFRLTVSVLVISTFCHPLSLLRTWMILHNTHS